MDYPRKHTNDDIISLLFFLQVPESCDMVGEAEAIFGREFSLPHLWKRNLSIFPATFRACYLSFPEGPLQSSGKYRAKNENRGGFKTWPGWSPEGFSFDFCWRSGKFALRIPNLSPFFGIFETTNRAILLEPQLVRLTFFFWKKKTECPEPRILTIFDTGEVFLRAHPGGASKHVVFRRQMFTLTFQTSNSECFLHLKGTLFVDFGCFSLVEMVKEIVHFSKISHLELSGLLLYSTYGNQHQPFFLKLQRMI